MTWGGARPGCTVWLTGLPSAGKTSIAQRVATELLRRGCRVQVLDGDVVRRTLCADLGFSRADRCANVMRIGYVAELLARNGVVVLVAAIAPYRQARDEVRKVHDDAGVLFWEVLVDTSPQECAKRDVKGLYARQRAGLISGLTGVDAPYEAPGDPELVLRTECRTVAESARELISAFEARVPGERCDDGVAPLR